MTKGPKPRSWLDRFEALFIPEPMSGCWIWLGGLHGSGYGAFSKTRCKMIGAHRAAWIIYRGQIGDAHVLHHCDNKLCVNPDHLYLGTHLQNMRDAHKRSIKRRARKLTQQQVLEIRNSGELGRILAARFGVGQAMISLIRNNKSWI